ncbi:MAG: OmpH family outer membrane protein [Bacteroidota bacterium]|nr:MAG: OmpH family outer membrane protein [Bacteroidota bacterium]
MKRTLFLLLALTIGITLEAQKFAFVDTEYILNNIPNYKAAQDELDKQAAEWQTEVEARYQEIDKLYREYQAEKVLLTQEMRKKREEEIINSEREVKKLQNDYFGEEGLLFKKRQEKIKPIQDEVFNALKEISNESGYAIIFDSAGGPTVLYTNPRFDISDEVLIRLGYKN